MKQGPEVFRALGLQGLDEGGRVCVCVCHLYVLPKAEAGHFRLSYECQPLLPSPSAQSSQRRTMGSACWLQSTMYKCSEIGSSEWQTLTAQVI